MNTGTTAYPAALDAYENPTTTTLENESGFSHAALHSQVHEAIEAIERVLGTNSGTSVIRNFTAGQFPVRINSGGTLIDSLALGTFAFPTIISPNVSGGTFNSAVIGTPAITGGTIATPAKVVPLVGTLTDAIAVIPVNAAAGQLFELTMGTTAGGRSIGNPTNASDGMSVTYRIRQNAANTGTLLWENQYVFSSEVGTPTIGTASTWNYYGFRYLASGTVWHFVGQTKNII